MGLADLRGFDRYVFRGDYVAARLACPPLAAATSRLSNARMARVLDRKTTHFTEYFIFGVLLLRAAAPIGF